MQSMPIVSLIMLLLLCGASPAAAKLTPAELDPKGTASGSQASRIAENWLKSPVLSQSQVGVEIMDLPSGKIIFSRNGNRRFTPASTAKVLTTACALDKLGFDFQYSTRLKAFGQIKKDQLLGDLVLVPSQDPTFELKDLYQLLSPIAARKLKRIEGKLQLSAIASGSDQFNTGWLVEDWGQEWMPVSSNFVLDHNLAPSKDPGRGLKANESSPEDALTSSLLASDMAPGWAIFDQASGSVKVYRSSRPSISKSASLVVANPAEYNLAVTAGILDRMGVRISSRPGQAPAGGEGEIIAEHLSEPLPEIIRQCLKESDNLYAQQLLRTIGLKSVGGGLALEDSGLSCLRAWLAELGVSSNDAVLVDGCGLSRKNFVTPHALNMVLKHMSSGGSGGKYVDLMRLEKTPGGYFRFKTGAMDSVRAVTGVIKTAGGNTLAMTVMVNGHTPSVSQIKGSIFSLCQKLEAMPAYQPAP